MKAARTKELADQIEELGRSIKQSYQDFRRSSLVWQLRPSRLTRFPTEADRKLRVLKPQET